MLNKQSLPKWVREFKNKWGFYPICGGKGETVVQAPTPPPAPNIAATSKEAIEAQIAGLPRILETQLEFGPKFTQAELEQQQEFGPQFTQAQLELQQEFGPQIAESLLGIQEQFGPRIGGALRAEQEAAQPELGAARGRLTEFLGEAGGVTPEEAGLFGPEAGEARGAGINRIRDIVEGREEVVTPEFGGVGRGALEQFVGQEATFSPEELSRLQEDIRGAQGVRGFGLQTGAGGVQEAEVISRLRRERELQRLGVAQQLSGFETEEARFGAGLKESALTRRAGASQLATTLPDELKQLLELRRSLQTQRLNIALSTAGRAPVAGISQVAQPGIQQPQFGPGQLVQNVQPGQAFGLASNVFGTQSAFKSSIFNTQQTAATARRGQNMSLAGDIIGGGLAGFGAAQACWVAAELFGGWFKSKTVASRYYVNNLAPQWFKNFYLKYGERIAKFVSNKPFIKMLIRPLFEYFAIKGTLVTDRGAICLA